MHKLQIKPLAVTESNSAQTQTLQELADQPKQPPLPTAATETQTANDSLTTTTTQHLTNLNQTTNAVGTAMQSSAASFMALQNQDHLISITQQPQI